MQTNNAALKVLMIDVSNGFSRLNRYPVGDFFGPVDLGIHLSHKHNSLNIGAGLLAGSIFPGSNRLIFSGISPCWHGFYISSMGGAALVFDDLFGQAAGQFMRPPDTDGLVHGATADQQRNQISQPAFVG